MDSKQELRSHILDLEHEVWDAVVRRDGESLGRHFADDYIEITLNGDRIEKSTIVAESPQVDEIERYTIDSVKFRMAGKDSVILSYHLVLEGKCKGVPIVPPDRWSTSIWSRYGGKWQCCFFQQSPFKA